MNTDYTTHYLKLKLRSPLMVAASPLTSELDVLRRIDDLGAGAAVLPSLFEEQLEEEVPGQEWNEFQGTSPRHFRELLHYNRGPNSYLRYSSGPNKRFRCRLSPASTGRRPEDGSTMPAALSRREPTPWN